MPHCSSAAVKLNPSKDPIAGFSASKATRLVESFRSTRLPLYVAISGIGMVDSYTDVISLFSNESASGITA